MGDYKKALQHYETALKIYTIIGDNLRMAYCHSGLGLTNESIGEHKESLEHYNQAIEKRKKMKDMVGIAREYYNISFVFSNTGKNKGLWNLLQMLNRFLKNLKGVMATVILS